MKSLFTKKSKKGAVKVSEISKTELKNIVGGADIATTIISGVKISSDKTTSFFHS
jgi:bacteriocin-like protein